MMAKFESEGMILQDIRKELRRIRKDLRLLIVIIDERKSREETAKSDIGNIYASFPFILTIKEFFQTDPVPDFF